MFLIYPRRSDIERSIVVGVWDQQHGKAFCIDGTEKWLVVLDQLFRSTFVHMLKLVERTYVSVCMNVFNTTRHSMCIFLCDLTWGNKDVLGSVGLILERQT